MSARKDSNYFLTKQLVYQYIHARRRPREVAHILARRKDWELLVPAPKDSNWKRISRRVNKVSQLTDFSFLG